MKRQRIRNADIIRILLLMASILILINLATIHVFAEGESLQKDFVSKQAEAIEKTIDRNINKNEGLKQLFPGFNGKEVLKDLTTGNFKFKPQEIFKRLMNIFFSELLNSLSLGLKVIVAILMISLVNFLKSSFGGTKVSDIAFFCGYIVISVMLYKVLQNGLDMTKGIVQDSADLLYSSFPVLLVLMAAAGGIVSSVIVKPFYMFAIMFLFSLPKKVIFPLILFQISVAFISNFAEKVNLKGISTLIRQITIWLMSIFLTVFVAVLAMQGSLGYSIDSVAAKTAKFTIGTMIPFAGKYIADAAETVLGCSILLKNSAGIFVFIILAGMCTLPLIKMIAISIFFKVLTVVSELFLDKRFSGLLSDVSNIFFMMAGIIATIVIVYYISICFVLGNARFL